MTGLSAARGFARWALGLNLDAVPAPARRGAIRHLMDGVGCAIGGFVSGAGNPAVTMALGLGGWPEATAIGVPGRVAAPAAAPANGTLVHALDFDDTHAGGLVHATAMVLPAALAIGEELDADGPAVLTAAIAGYEMACRLTAMLPNGFHQRGLHPTATCGVFSAALVASRLMGLPGDRTVDALGIAGGRARGLLEFLATGSSTKQLHPGFAAHAGILAARLGAAGASGPESVLEGRYGLHAALLGTTVDAAHLTAGLGEVWEVGQITIKPYPACQLPHVTLDAAAAVGHAGERVDPDGIDEVDAHVHPDCAAIVCEPIANKLIPRTPYDAKFSFPWSVAALLIDGAVGTATYTADAIRRPDVTRLAGRVRVRVVPTAGVAADASGLVELRLADGRTLTGRVAASRGGPANLLGDADLDTKALLSCPPAGQEKARALGRASARPRIRGVDPRDLYADQQCRRRPVDRAARHRVGRRTYSPIGGECVSITDIRPHPLPWFAYAGYTFSLGRLTRCPAAGRTPRRGWLRSSRPRPPWTPRSTP